MKFTVVDYAGEFGCHPNSIDSVLTGLTPDIALTELTEYAQFKPVKQVIFTQSELADSRIDRWQILINVALANSNLIELSQDAPVLMVLPYVDAKFSQMQNNLIDSVIAILPAWTRHPDSHYYLLGSAGFYQALRQADVLLSSGMEQVVIGAVDSWATEQGLLKFIGQFSDYDSVVLPASEGAVFIVLSRQSQGIEVLNCGMDVVIDRQAPSGLIAIIADLVAKQTQPVQYLSLCHSGDKSLDQVGHNTLGAISGLYDANTQFLTPEITQGDIGACYSLLHFLHSYHHYKQHIWQGTSLQMDTSSLPYVGAAIYRWCD
ncbi:hypothetical protein HWV03_11800 [Moritella sp. 36]|uniref:hypothetical protein n=1 Tax=Moritella sp. 36 TaxID=2746233 RepID=UPI001BA5BD03|nr:hypothetical protein [Moritella sp. 36]QUM89432.1 hypothetical protein HWV03_11800 [Moritella sp. 36]